MAKERLSHLQKWILKKLYGEGYRGFKRRNIYKEYFGVDTNGAHKLMKDCGERWKSWSLYPRVHQTLKNMEEKNLICIYHREDRYNSRVLITWKGIHVANKLIQKGGGKIIINDKDIKDIKDIKPIHEKVTQMTKYSLGISADALYKSRKIKEWHELGFVSEEEVKKLETGKLKINFVYKKAKNRFENSLLPA